MSTPLIIFLTLCVICAILVIFAMMRGGRQSRASQNAWQESEKEKIER